MPTNSINLVFEKVCLNSGHFIVDRDLGQVFDLASKTVLNKRESLCLKCGMYLDEIRAYREVKRRNRGPNKSNGDIIPNGKEG